MYIIIVISLLESIAIVGRFSTVHPCDLAEK